MKKFAVIFIFLFSLCFPLLAEDILNNPAYIAQLGYGSTKDSAESNALAALSKFFQMNISVQAKEQTILNDSNFETTLSEEVFVQSNTELFAVHYTKPKYAKKQKQYEVIAYIDRKEAWIIYEPKINDCTSQFEQFYFDAISQNDAILKIAGLSKAYQNAKENELYQKLDFAQILNPNQAEKFSGTRNHLSEIEPMLRRIAKQCSISIFCENDFGESVSRAVGKFFSNYGITIAENNSQYFCYIKVIENLQVLPAGIFYSPSFSLKIETRDTVLISGEGQLKRIGAKNPTVAQQRAYTSLSQEILKLLQKEFMSL